LEALSYTLFVNREPAPPRLLAAIQQIEVETGVERGADMMRLRIAIGPKDDRTGWSVVDSGVFGRLAPIRLAINIGGAPAELLMDALVTEVSMTFSERPGESVLNVVAMDPSVLLNLEEKNSSWPDKSDSEIAQTIFASASKEYLGKFGHKLVPKVEQTTLKRNERNQKVVQSRTTDMRYLKRLADRNENCVVYVATNRDSGDIEGHFHPKHLDPEPQGELRVNRGAATNVSSFNVSFNMMLPAVVSGAGTDADTQNPDQDVTANRIKQPMMGPQSTLPTENPRRVMLKRTASFDRNELQGRAQAEVDRQGQKAIRATGEVTTAAYGGLLLPDRPVKVTGAGPDFSGRYYVESVSHTLSGEGYTQSFSLSRNALGQEG
jgi:phage protein D